MKKNIICYKFYSVFSNFMFQKGLFIIFLTTSAGLSNFKIGILQATLFLTNLLTEVPAGIFGDKYGRKISVLTGLSIQAVAAAGYLVFNNFYCILLLFILEGLGMSFVSGSDESLLYDDLKLNKQEDKFLNIISKARSYGYYALAAATFLGGVLQKLSWNLVYGCTSLGFIMAFLVFSLITENKNTHNDKAKVDEKPVALNKVVVNYLKTKEGTITLKFMIIISLFEASFMSYFMFSQKFFQLNGFSNTVIALIFTIARLLSGLGFVIVPIVSKKLSHKNANISIMIITGVLLMLNYFDFKYYYVISFLVVIILPYTLSALNSNFIHERIPSNIRASMISFNSMISSTILCTLYLVLGGLLDLLQPNLVISIIACFSFFSCIFFIKTTKNTQLHIDKDIAS